MTGLGWGHVPRQGAPVGLRVGKVLGIELRLGPSLIIVFGLIAFALGSGTFPAWHPEWSMMTSYGVAIVAAVAFLLSILAHELSHALVGRALGVEIREITLFMFGGLTSMKSESRSPKTEFLMTIVGPLTSLVLGIVGLWLAVATASAPELAETDPIRFFRQLGPTGTVLAWLGPINVVLAAFNMIPGFPLDGGRVLRAGLWWISGDLHKATLWASRVGQGVGLGLVALGLLMMFGTGVPFFGGGFINGLWLVLLGWFLATAARASYTSLITRDILKDTPVHRLMRGEIETVSPHVTIAELVDRFMESSEQRSFPVMENGRFLGSVTVQDVRSVDRLRWESATVAEILVGREPLPPVEYDSDAEAALARMIEEHQDQLPVIEEGRVRGFLRQQDIVRWLALQSPMRT